MNISARQQSMRSCRVVACQWRHSFVHSPMDIVTTTLLSPVILFFVLGVLAAIARSDLTIPEPIAKGMSLYLMAAIGLKGGAQVASGGFSAEMAYAAAAGIALSASIPLLAFGMLRWFGRLDVINASAVAAHYGSVSVVTFVTGIEVLKAAGIPAGGYMVGVLALMETPAIVTGLWLAKRYRTDNAAGSSGMWHEVLLNGSVVLLLGSFTIGLIAGPAGMAPIKPVFETAFRGVLCLFLLDMGLVAVRRLQASKMLTIRLMLLGILFPLCNGCIGAVIGRLIGLPVGSAAALAILSASASYIAVPAAVRLALPEANPGLYLSMSLAITFPFNVVLGIPLYIFITERLFGVAL
jgi:uncharacterized protein